MRRTPSGYSSCCHARARTTKNKIGKNSPPLQLSTIFIFIKSVVGKFTEKNFSAILITAAVTST